MNILVFGLVANQTFARMNKRTVSSFAGIVMLLSLALFPMHASADEGAIEQVRAELTKMIPQAANAEIVASPLEGVYRIQVQSNYAFAYVQGDYVLIGDLFDTRNQVNLGDQAESERMAKLLKDVPTSKMIVYGPANAERYITVFTDIDCGYCRKLHREVPQLTDAGIQVRYLAFPRSGVGSNSHKKYVSVWCNDDPHGSLTKAKAGENVAPATCDNPIEETYELGKTVGVRGTPTIIFDDGSVTPGYIPFQAVLQRMGLDQG